MQMVKDGGHFLLLSIINAHICALLIEQGAV
jgi:hypothetical protein